MKTVRIGRNPDNDIVYNVQTISGNHADINIYDDGQMQIIDHSTNGTWINGSMLQNAAALVTCSDQVVFPGNIVLDWNQVAAFMRQPVQPVFQQPTQPAYPQPVQHPVNPPVCRKSKSMFSAPFSINGRIRRSEWLLTNIILSFGVTLLTSIIFVLCFGGSLLALAGEAYGGAGAGIVIGVILLIVLSVVCMWVSIAQNAKRCHDMNHSGWFQLIPFYGFWMLFVDGTPGPNDYGESPKF